MTLLLFDERKDDPPMPQDDKPVPDWNPFTIDGSDDPRELYDAVRAQCPVAYSERLQWSVLGHDEVMQVLTGHETFSNQVSRYLSVPNGMDPPEHGLYRSVIVPYFARDRIRSFEPVCRATIADLAQERLANERVELISAFALDVSVRIHCAFLGWSPSLYEPLADWTLRGAEAARTNDRAALAHVAREFTDMVGELLAQRRAGEALPEHDVTAELMHETVSGRFLDDAEITSILRNWTVGEIGTTSASVGILTHFLAEHRDLQAQLRHDPSLLPPAIDEILRLHGPLVTNRRVASRDVELGGRTIEAGQRITINWVAANRDERTFENPAEFSWERDPAKNLLYGAGIHVCPGSPLARLELRLLMEELLRQTEWIALDPAAQPVFAAYPASGFAALPVLLTQPESGH